MTFEKLNQQFDMLCLFRRIERNLRAGKAKPERVRCWAEDTAKATVPQNMANAQEFIDAITDHCSR
ncbi:hypothetical protein [Hydrogenoanaerobacterium sp.]|uniref:hypothetical protein n=1 Tax=Hydrogenoanaerobacterium sp. TaxID=2953763 RepID=UPI00289E969B|nr:hypothetical protein [Hydrogenoanaerobacterium sp.]